MGKGDRRHSNFSKQRATQRKKKARAKRLAVERQTRLAGAEKAAEKKRAPRRASAAATPTSSS